MSEMTKKTRKATQARAANARRAGWWIVGVILLAVVVVGGYRIWDKPIAGPEPAKLLGRWVRPDGGYVLELSDVKSEGKLKAAYFNPRPINVAKTAWQSMDDRIQVFVELRDVNYPGSTYTLIYDPEQDRLNGYYYQAALKGTFGVVFIRKE